MSKEEQRSIVDLYLQMMIDNYMQNCTMEGFMLRTVIVFFVFLALHSTSLAQSSDCSIVLTRALRNSDIQLGSEVHLNSIYNQYCSSTGETNSSSYGIDIGFTVKSIPVNLTGSAADANSAMSNFCKTYKSDSTVNTEQFRYQETIVERAYQSYDSCVALSLNGNLVVHDFISLSNTQIYLRAGIAKPVEIRGVHTSQNVACTGASDGKAITYTENTPIRTDTSLTINCVRNPRQTTDGQLIYDEGSIAIDIALGKYSVFLPRDTRLPEDLASTISTTMSGLVNEISALKQMTPKVDYAACTFFQNLAQDQVLDGVGDVNASEQCPADMVLIGLAGGRGHSGDYNEPHGLKCCKLKAN